MDSSCSPIICSSLKGIKISFISYPIFFNLYRQLVARRSSIVHFLQFQINHRSPVSFNIYGILSGDEGEYSKAMRAIVVLNLKNSFMLILTLLFIVLSYFLQDISLEVCCIFLDFKKIQAKQPGWFFLVCKPTISGVFQSYVLRKEIYL